MGLSTHRCCVWDGVDSNGNARRIPEGNASGITKAQDLRAPGGQLTRCVPNRRSLGVIGPPVAGDFKEL